MGSNEIFKYSAANFGILDEVSLGAGFDCYRISVSHSGAFLYVVGYGSGKIAKISTTSMDIVSVLEPLSGEGALLNFLVSPDDLYGYAMSDLGVIVKVALGANMNRVSALTLSHNAQSIYAGDLDATGTNGYFASTTWNPSLAPTIHKVDLSGNMSELSYNDLLTGDGYIMDLIFVDESKLMYMSTNQNEVRVNTVFIDGLTTAYAFLPEGFTQNGSSVVSVDRKKIYTLAWDSEVGEVFEISTDDSSVISRTVLGDVAYNSYFISLNTVSGDLYAGHDRFFDGQTQVFNAGIAKVANFPQGVKPSAPRSLKVKYEVKKATFTWNEPASNGGREITSYLYCYKNCSKTKSWENTGKLKAVVKGLPKGSKGTFQVRAVNSIGFGPIKKLNFKQAK